ncbi:chromatin accessibility complex protein 1 [Drosophila novamexicana]|uniref:chromatin accessibility complex protein 1 n=1 Tax=Drosophila novamexicana TaxID=47314 RepID=UPI0011E593F7|nr:chromatin accessibility complex protein 1 [Drosophila novamexicana]
MPSAQTLLDNNLLFVVDSFSCNKQNTGTLVFTAKNEAVKKAGNLFIAMVDSSKTHEQRKPSADTFLPLSRVRTIMKSSMDTGLITNEVLFLMTKCTELFVQHLAREAYTASCAKQNSDTLKYEHLSQLVNKSKNLEFLLQIVPEKIRVHEFQEMLRLNRSNANASDDDDDETGTESESEDE